MVDAVIVEVYGALDQPEAQEPLAEVEIGLRLVHRRGDVVQGLDRVLHDVSPGVLVTTVTSAFGSGTNVRRLGCRISEGANERYGSYEPMTL